MVLNRVVQGDVDKEMGYKKSIGKKNHMQRTKFLTFTSSRSFDHVLAEPDHVDFKAFTVILQCLKKRTNPCCLSMICKEAF